MKFAFEHKWEKLRIKNVKNIRNIRKIFKLTIEIKIALNDIDL